MQPIKPGAQPFATDNLILAFSLYMAGVPEAEKPISNEYTPDILRNLGFRGSIDPIEAVKEAIRTNRRGRVRYFFQPVKELKALIKAFRDQEAEIKAPRKKIDAAKAELAIMQKVVKGEMDPQEALVRIQCISLIMRVQFAEMWRKVPGMWIVENPGRATTHTTANGEKITKHPGWHGVSSNASQETRERLGFK